VLFSKYMSDETKKIDGLTMHGARVALTPARAVTSHLRKRYRERYRGRYKYASLVFAFDLAVFGIAATLVAINIYIYLALPPQKPTLGVVFKTAPVQTAAPQALFAEVDARGQDSNGPVSLRWNLPAGTEILEAEPPLDSSNEVQLGNLKAGENATSRLVVRFFSPQGNMRFGFEVSDNARVLTGYESRQVTGSALLFEPLFDDGATRSDGSIPMRLSNRSNRLLENITLAGVDQTLVDALEPDQDMIVFAKPGHVSALMRAYPIVERELVAAPINQDAKITLRPSTGNTARLDVSIPVAGKVEVYHPGLVHPHIKKFDVPAGTRTLTIPLDRPSDDAAWYAVASGPAGYGIVAESRVTTPFDASAAIRYYASTGDQIGIGPLPPRVGEETRYWLQVALGPTSKDLSDVSIRMRLPSGVKHTGRDALPSGGGISETDGELIWKLPYLAANSEGATVRVELALIPTESMIGKAPLLIESISARAIEVASGLTLDASINGLDTSLPEDEKGRNKGIVE